MRKRKSISKFERNRLSQWSYLFGPWHPALVPFPIVCSTLAVLALWSGATCQIDWLAKVAGILWVLTFVTALAGLFTGHFFAHRLGRYSKWPPLPPSSTGPLHFHALLGTIALFISLTALPGAFRLVRGQSIPILTQFFLGIAAAVFFAWGAHEGGEMTFKMEMVPLAAPRSRAGSKPARPRHPHPFPGRLKGPRGSF